MGVDDRIKREHSKWEKQVLRRRVDEGQNLKTQRGFREGIVNCTIRLKVRFRAGELELHGRRRVYTRSPVEEEVRAQNASVVK